MDSFQRHSEIYRQLDRSFVKPESQKSKGKRQCSIKSMLAKLFPAGLLWADYDDSSSIHSVRVRRPRVVVTSSESEESDISDQASNPQPAVERTVVYHVIDFSSLYDDNNNRGTQSDPESIYIDLSDENTDDDDTFSVVMPLDVDRTIEPQPKHDNSYPSRKQTRHSVKKPEEVIVDIHTPTQGTVGSGRRSGGVEPSDGVEHSDPTGARGDEGDVPIAINNSRVTQKDTFQYQPNCSCGFCRQGFPKEEARRAASESAPVLWYITGITFFVFAVMMVCL